MTRRWRRRLRRLTRGLWPRPTPLEDVLARGASRERAVDTEHWPYLSNGMLDRELRTLRRRGDRDDV